MRLGTKFEMESGQQRPFFEYPFGKQHFQVPLSELFTLPRSSDLRIEHLAHLEHAIQHLAEIRPYMDRYLEVHSASPQELVFVQLGLDPSKDYLLAPIPHPLTFRDFYAFEQHVKTARAKRGLEVPAAWYELPVFYFSNPGSLVGHEHSVYAPAGSQELDYELELGLLIGKGGKDIPPTEQAWEHVAGFTIINDLSARDLQRKEMAVGLGPAKGKDFATAVGPYLVTLDEFQDRIDQDGRVDLEMLARVNGKELSRGNAKSMHFNWPQLIAQASRDAELYPGDLLGSGTVGSGCILELGPEHTGGWLKPGDVVELEIERLGILRTPIIARPIRSANNANSRE